MKNNLLLWGGIGVIAVVALVAIAVRWTDRSASLPAPEVASSQPGTCRDFTEGAVTIDGSNQTLQVAVAQTKEERTQGLGGCEAVPENSGMYFSYEPAQDAYFWMKGMKIPIDIVWIADGKVVGIEEQVPIPTSAEVKPLIYQSPGKVSAVLEVGSGKAKEYGLAAGTSVNYIPK